MVVDAADSPAAHRLRILLSRGNWQHCAPDAVVVGIRELEFGGVENVECVMVLRCVHQIAADYCVHDLMGNCSQGARCVDIILARWMLRVIGACARRPGVSRPLVQLRPELYVLCRTGADLTASLMALYSSADTREDAFDTW